MVRDQQRASWTWRLNLIGGIYFLGVMTPINVASWAADRDWVPGLAAIARAVAGVMWLTVAIRLRRTDRSASDAGRTNCRLAGDRRGSGAREVPTRMHGLSFTDLLGHELPLVQDAWAIP